MTRALHFVRDVVAKAADWLDLGLAFLCPCDEPHGARTVALGERCSCPTGAASRDCIVEAHRWHAEAWATLPTERLAGMVRLHQGPDGAA